MGGGRGGGGARRGGGRFCRVKSTVKVTHIPLILVYMTRHVNITSKDFWDGRSGWR